MIGSKKVLVFGVFDRLHDGHRFFLTNAKELGTTLSVAVAPDKVVLTLKGTLPHTPLSERIQNLKASGLADEIFAGDELLGGWDILERIEPDIVALGYDQKALEEPLKAFISKHNLDIHIVTLEPLFDGTLHSSNLV